MEAPPPARFGGNLRVRLCFPQQICRSRGHRSPVHPPPLYISHVFALQD